MDVVKEPRFRASRLQSGSWKVEKRHEECCKCGAGVHYKTIAYTYFLLAPEEQETLAETIADLLNLETAT